LKNGLGSSNHSAVKSANRRIRVRSGHLIEIAAPASAPSMRCWFKLRRRMLPALLSPERRLDRAEAPIRRRNPRELKTGSGEQLILAATMANYSFCAPKNLCIRLRCATPSRDHETTEARRSQTAKLGSTNEHTAIREGRLRRANSRQGWG